MSVFIVLEFIYIIEIFVATVTVTVAITVEISMYYGLQASIVLLGFLLSHLHPFPASYLSVVVSDQVVIHRATYVHKTIVGRDNLRFGILLGSTRRLGFIIESIQFLIVLESMFQKLPEANSIDCNFSSCVRIQCVSRCAHLCIYVFLFSLFKPNGCCPYSVLNK